ncbi:hypothetical protein M569_03883 [Genlisea aurea]|uniref:Uncharacterized protein n=1 Tax=Genlisea aurea TaxID=192259 RepID=S8D0P9_9LAMI|nr:hypothetical protein M569_03883 [Genlisea aurea]
MAAKWIKSLRCKSTAINDVVDFTNNTLPHSSSCKNSFHSLRDVVVDPTKKSNSKPPRAAAAPPLRLIPGKPIGESIFPALTELPAGHPSRNVVEIIFRTRWGDKGGFPGRIEMVFKVRHLTRTLTRFEDYREAVKSRAKSAAVAPGGEEHGRCVADGNEVMRFHCLGAADAGGAYEVGCSAWGVYGGKGAAVCTYSGSGAAHENAGAGKDRRAMLVSRVISGRVFKRFDFDPELFDPTGFDSVSGDCGELLVCDSRALLPCFLIIYKL